MKKALLTGITGQDGSYLAEFLLGQGYEVHGIVRRTRNLEYATASRLFFHTADLSDASALSQIMERVAPDEVYNIAAQTNAQVSFHQPEYTADVTATGCLRLLEAVRQFMHQHGGQIRFFQAGSSEMFGVSAPPQSELTPFHPRSPYAVSKMAAHWYTVNYREEHKLFACNGILFNHESPRRGESFVTRKITRALARIRLGLQDKLYLGNLDSKRDWGFAGDYVRAMWLMLQQDEPDDYVVATGEAHSVRDLLTVAANRLNLDWERYVEIDPKYYRPAEPNYMLGDAGKARRKLGWEPGVSFRQLIEMMVDHDFKLISEESAVAESADAAV